MAKEPAAQIALPSSKRGLKGFWSETMREMRKVNWPSPQETTRLTGVVLTVCILQGIILLLMGGAFSYIIDFLTKGSGK